MRENMLSSCVCCSFPLVYPCPFFRRPRLWLCGHN
jgi:hypothetical protein